MSGIWVKADLFKADLFKADLFKADLFKADLASIAADVACCADADMGRAEFAVLHDTLSRRGLCSFTTAYRCQTAPAPRREQRFETPRHNLRP